MITLTTISIPATVSVPRTVRINHTKDITPKTGPLSWARPGNTMEITVGDRYLKALALAHASKLYDYDGHEADTGNDFDENAQKSEVPTKAELDELRADMREEITDLIALGITVDAQDKRGNWTTRAPKAGDIVSVPRDLWIDRESKEPEENREEFTTVRAGKVVHRHSPERNMPWGCDKPTDKIGGFVTLADILDDRNATRLATLCDVHNEGKITCALRVLSSMGLLSADTFVSNECAPGFPTPAGMRTATLNLADKMRQLRGKKPKDGYWYLWTMGVRVWVEIPVHEYWDNNDRISTWCAVDSE